MGPGQRLERGQRIGRIMLGSTTTFDIPGRHRLLVPPGSQVVAGETEIAPSPAAVTVEDDAATQAAARVAAMPATGGLMASPGAA